MDIAKLIADMVRAGTDPDIVGRVAEAFVEQKTQVVVVRDDQADRRREKDRQRKRLKATANSADSAEFAENEIGVSSPSSSLSPTPPILTTSSPSKTPEGEISLEKTVDTLPEANSKPVVEIVSAAERRFNRLVYPALPDDWAGFAAERGVSRAEAEELFELFANHWTAKAGRGGRKRDWPALWENWVIDALQRRAWRRKHHGKHATGAGPEPRSPGSRRGLIKRYLQTALWKASWGKRPSVAEVEEVEAALTARG